MRPAAFGTPGGRFLYEAGSHPGDRKPARIYSSVAVLQRSQCAEEIPLSSMQRAFGADRTSVPRILRASMLALLAGLVAAGPTLAQATPLGPGDQAPPGSPQALMAEYQQVQARLGRLQVQAIQDNPDLSLRRDAIDEMVMAAMIEINPEAETQMARLSELSEEASVAQQAQNMDAMQTIMNEVMEIRSNLDAAQSEAISRDDVRSEIESFEEDLMARVAEIDPEAPGLLVRLEELAAELSAGDPGGF